MRTTMVAAVRGQIEIHKAAVERLEHVYSNEKLFDDTKASLAERDAGAKPTPREQLARK